jgi:hypothetical protein
MKRLILISLVLLSVPKQGKAQDDYGNTLNIGLGIGYYGYTDHSIPVLNINYEFDVADNFTLAPFISYYSYSHSYYWGNKNYPYKYYHYRETVIPIGVKATYYFDEALSAGNDWDFYLGGSLGVAFIRNRWDDDYYGDKYGYRRSRSATPLYLDLHVGAEYHVNDRIGLFLDLSSGVSTFGIAIH